MTLGGFQMVRNGNEFDYCYIESIQSMLAICDKVAVVDCGSDDGTDEALRIMEAHEPKLIVKYLKKEIWDALVGKEKLSYFQNMAAEMLDTDYQLLIQSDEVLDETSAPGILAAMHKGEEGYMCTRTNLWESPFLELNVPLSRMPCSPQVIRLTRTGYKCYDDGENIGAQADMTFVDFIRIAHMGFVRKREVMKAKIINMQCGVFNMEHYDSKLDLEPVFNPRLWFSPKDLKPISRPLPAIIQKWAMSRVY